RHGDLELLGQRLQMSLRQASRLVLDEVEIFDQQRALSRTITENRANGSHLLLAQNAAARKRRRLAATRAWMDGATPSPEYAVALGNVIHAKCPNREIRLIVRRARNEFRDLMHTGKTRIPVRFRSRSPLTNPAQRDGADFSIITLGACAAGACFLGRRPGWLVNRPAASQHWRIGIPYAIYRFTVELGPDIRA